MALTVVGQIFHGDNSPQGKSGQNAEQEVLNCLQDIFEGQGGKIFVNQKIVGFSKVPDFLIPVFSKTSEGKLSFILIECKAEKYIKADGSTKYSDPCSQMQEYRNAIRSCFKLYNKAIEIECFAIFPNKYDFNTRLKDGRDDIRWGNLSDLKEKLKNREVVSEDHDFFNIGINYIYNRRKPIRSKRIEINERKAKANIKSFGGIFGFKGVAGTGKTYLLADQIFNDAMEAKRELLYITHNKNLVDVFVKQVEKLSSKKAIDKPHPLAGDENKSVKQIILDNNSVIYFVNFDAFPTRIFTRGLDKIIYQKNSYGPLYKMCNRYGIGGKDEDKKNIEEEDYIKCRRDLIDSLKKTEFAIRCNHQLFDGVYVDELQDCKQDPNRLRIPLMFTAHNEDGVPNVFFSEDTLQTYLNWEKCIELNKIQQEEDEETIEIRKRKDNEITYKDLFELDKPLHSSRFLSLTHVYRTPENIFKASFSLLKDGFKKGKYEELESRLSFELNGGSILKFSELEAFERITEERKKASLNSIMVISHRKDKVRLKATHHHFECRGCESDFVFIYIHNDFLNNPNYLYTLMCRTKDSLAFVKMNNGDDEKFEDIFKSLMKKCSSHIMKEKQIMK